MWVAQNTHWKSSHLLRVGTQTLVVRCQGQSDVQSDLYAPGRGIWIRAPGSELSVPRIIPANFIPNCFLNIFKHLD